MRRSLEEIKSLSEKARASLEQYPSGYFCRQLGELRSLDGTKIREDDDEIDIAFMTGYISGALDEIEYYDKLCDCGEASDGYHTFNELYDFRREYNAALVNTGVWKAHKSHRHHTGEECFGGRWFIVVIDTPFGQISNHYENKYWNEFHCEEKEFADEWDGHTEKDVLERLRNCNLKRG